MEIKLDSTYKGTRILLSETAKNKRFLLNQMIEILESYGYQEIMIILLL
jgi:histidyl-tRNA synthetase